MKKDTYINDLAHKWINDLHNKPFNSTSEEMCFQKYAYEDGFKKGYNDAIEDIVNIIKSYLPLPAPNSNYNNDIKLLEARLEYAKTFASFIKKKLEEIEYDTN